MKRQFLFLFIALIVINTTQAQVRGTKIGYIDMEYILQNVPAYLEAQNQLEQKAQKWKQEVESKKIEINKLKEALKAEKALLTKGLIEERETEIKFLENEMLEYQQKRFGPNGDLMIQKTLLTKPIQDQVFTAVQDISEAKKYDFIFDKTSDMTMIFAAKRFDISDQVLRVITRSDKREQLTKKQLKEEEAKENKEDGTDENPALTDRQKALDEKKAVRDKAIADRKLLFEEKKKAAEDKKNQIISDREAKKAGVTPANTKTSPSTNDTEKEALKNVAAEAKQKQIDARTQALEERKKGIEDTKKVAEEKRKQILEEREAKKSSTATPTPSKTEINNTEKEATKALATEAKQKQIDARAKNLEDRKKAIEEAKKVSEEKRKQILEQKETKKTGTVSELAKREDVTTTNSFHPKDSSKVATENAKQKQTELRAKTLEERKKALEEKRKKILEERETKRKKDTLK